MVVTFAIYDLHPDRGGRLIATEAGSLTLDWDTERQVFTITPFLGVRFQLPPKTREPKYLAIYNQIERILAIPIKLDGFDRYSRETTTVNYDWELTVTLPNESNFSQPLIGGR